MENLNSSHEMGLSEINIEEFKKRMMKISEMTDLGLLFPYLGIKVHQGGSQIALCQNPYATN